MKLNVTSEKMLHLVLAMLTVYSVMLLPMDALAEPTALSGVLCNVVGWFTGTIGAGIATLAIIVIGVGALMGKVSWGMAIIVGLGVGVIFGASGIATALGATSTCGV